MIVVSIDDNVIKNYFLIETNLINYILFYSCS